MPVRPLVLSAVSPLHETCKQLKEEIAGRKEISVEEKKHMHLIIDQVREEVLKGDFHPASHHDAFREALVARAKESRPLAVAWLKFQRLVASGATQQRIDEEIGKAFSNDRQMNKAITSLHASILLRHFDALRSRPGGARGSEKKLIAAASAAGSRSAAPRKGTPAYAGRVKRVAGNNVSMPTGRRK